MNWYLLEDGDVLKNNDEFLESSLWETVDKSYWGDEYSFEIWGAVRRKLSVEDFEAKLYSHILRNWNPDRRYDFAKSLLGNEFVCHCGNATGCCPHMISGCNNWDGECTQKEKVSEYKIRERK